jgi:hypothetical protein
VEEISWETDPEGVGKLSKHVRQIVSFRAETLEKLKRYLEERYPGRTVLSMVVDTAVIEYLEQQEETPKK